MNSNLTRRSFLKYSIRGAGLTLAVGFTPFGLRLAKAAEEKALDLKPFAYIEISPDNTVTVLVGQTELGQGTHTGIPMIVAEELGGLEPGGCPSGAGSRSV